MTPMRAPALEDAVTSPLWWDRLDRGAERPSLTDEVAADVVIVGAGFSGLWTAHHLSLLAPDRRIVVVERETVGFGASGRNGGWAVGELAGPLDRYAALGGQDAAVAQWRAVMDTVAEIGEVIAAEGIECDWAHGGNIRVARTRPQADRQKEEVDEMRDLGFGPDVIRLLDVDEARHHLGATDVLSGIFFAPCASLQPALLARGLAEAVERRGVVIHERTEATSITDGRVETRRGAVTAPVVVRATEAYTRDLPGARRDLLPVYSLMVATEPLDSDLIASIGLDGRPTFADDRRIVTYGQRTADDRIAFGSQGVPYLFGSEISPDNETDLGAHLRVHDVLVEMLPQLAGVPITHRWGGVLGIPRNWLPSVHFDASSGRGRLGGYVGEGVAAAHLAGRTMAELIAGEITPRTALPWVGAASRRWEPEPLRWLGVRGGRRIFAAADAVEERTDRPARITDRIARILRGD
ncbi:MAG: FAD-binding oxidoreductase [Actinomycetota bacterium]